MNLPERILNKLHFEPNSGCWLWDGALVHGYGYTKIEKQRRQIPVHRLTYEALRGPIPKGLVVDHLCRTRCCANPDHMEIVTHRVNILRGTGVSAVSAKKDSCVNGHPYEKAVSGFYKGRPYRRCRICINARANAHYAENRDTILTRRKTRGTMLSMLGMVRHNGEHR